MVKREVIELRGGYVCDPRSAEPSSVRSVFLRDGRIISEEVARGGGNGAENRQVIDVSDCIVMAGAIDAHTHIGGGKVNLARMMLPERIKRERMFEDSIRPLSCPVPSTIETGRRYLEMGYTACFEPAMIPAGARHAHLEMGDIPWLDTGGYVMLGNEELLLKLIAEKSPMSMIRDYVGWMVEAHQSLAVKVVNAVAVSAYKCGRQLVGIDDPHPVYGVTARQVLFCLARAVDELQLTHPIHVHCSDLGIPGNIQTTLATIDAVEGHRIHITHAQFHAYGKEGAMGMSSAASRLADVVNGNRQVSLDVGQVLFGQTVTLSGDLFHQFEARELARPRKGFFQSIECQGGCGVLPFRYRHSQYVHALQWTIGLELFLRVQDPWRLLLTTDHPNGAPFTSYPHLIRLLMDRDFRLNCFEHLHPKVKETSPLPSLKREYSLEEIAILTRAAPAKLLGLPEVGNLLPGAIADLCVYARSDRMDSMFAAPKMVLRHGQIVYRDGQFLGSAEKRTYRAKVEYDQNVWKHLRPMWEQVYSYSPQQMSIGDDELQEHCSSTPCNAMRNSGSTNERG